MKHILLACILFVTSVAFGAVADGNLVVAIRLDGLITLDPAQANEILGSEYLGNVYQTLVTQDDSGEEVKAVPNIAESWETSKNAKGGLSIIFKLKKHLRFASNNSVTAHDVVFSFHRVMKLKYTPAYIFNNLNLKPENVAVINNYTVKIDLDEYFPLNFVLSILSSPASSIVDKKVVSQYEVNGDFGNNWLKRNSAGSGPFLLEDWAPNQYLKLKRNKHYEHEVYLQSITLKHIPEPATQKLMLAKGDVDMARDIVDLEQLPVHTKFIAKPKSEIIYMAMNLEHPALANPKVRTAMKYLIDYRAIEGSIMKHKAVTHQSFLPKKFLGFSGDEPFTFNLTKAKKLLVEAGYSNGFEVELDAENIQLAQAIQAYLALAKIKVKIIPGDHKQVITKYRKGKHQMVLASWGADYLDPNANAFNFISSPQTSSFNLASRNNWEVPFELTLKTEQAAKALDTFTRVKLYRELQHEFFTTSPFIVLFQSNVVSVVRSDVIGFKLGITPFHNKYEFITKT